MKKKVLERLILPGWGKNKQQQQQASIPETHNISISKQSALDTNHDTIRSASTKQEQVSGNQDFQDIQIMELLGKGAFGKVYKDACADLIYKRTVSNTIYQKERSLKSVFPKFLIELYKTVRSKMILGLTTISQEFTNLIHATHFNQIRSKPGMKDGEILAVKVIEHQVPYNTNPTQQEILNRTFSINKDGIITLPLEVIVNQKIQHPNIVRTFKYHSKPVYDPREKNKQRRQQDKSIQQLFSRNQQKAGYLQDALNGSQDLSQYVGKIIETWLVLEFCDMGTLYEYILQQKLEKLRYQTKLEFIWLTAMDVAQAMQYLHSNQIVHGDLKSQNVLLSSSTADRRGFHVKVGDFGLSRILFQNYSHVNTKTHGTISYMPPEMLHEGRLAPAVDVYSYGILLWELFTGTVAFSGMNHFQVLVGIVQQGIIPNMYHQKLPNFIKPLLLDCWARDPTQRPSFLNIIQRLEQSLQSIMVTGDAILISPNFSVGGDSTENAKLLQQHAVDVRTYNMKQNMFRENSSVEKQKSFKGPPYIDTAKASDISQNFNKYQPQSGSQYTGSARYVQPSPTQAYVSLNKSLPDRLDYQPSVIHSPSPQPDVSKQAETDIQQFERGGSSMLNREFVDFTDPQQQYGREQASGFSSEQGQVLNSSSSSILTDSNSASQVKQNKKKQSQQQQALQSDRQHLQQLQQQANLNGQFDTYNNPYYLNLNYNKPVIDHDTKGLNLLVNKLNQENTLPQVQQHIPQTPISSTVDIQPKSNQTVEQIEGPTPINSGRKPLQQKNGSQKSQNTVKSKHQLKYLYQLQQQQEMIKNKNDSGIKGLKYTGAKNRTPILQNAPISRYLSDTEDLSRNQEKGKQKNNLQTDYIAHQRQKQMADGYMKIPHLRGYRGDQPAQDSLPQSGQINPISQEQLQFTSTIDSSLQTLQIPKSPKLPTSKTRRSSETTQFRSAGQGDIFNTLSNHTNGSSYKDQINNTLNNTITSQNQLVSPKYIFNDFNAHQYNSYLDEVMKKNAKDRQMFSPTITNYAPASKQSLEGGIASYQASINNMNYSIYENMTDNEGASQKQFFIPKDPLALGIDVNSQGYTNPYFNLTKNTLQQQQQQHAQLSAKLSAQQSSRSFSTYQEAIQDYNGSDFVSSNAMFPIGSQTASLNRENLNQHYRKEEQQMLSQLNINTKSPRMLSDRQSTQNQHSGPLRSSQYITSRSPILGYPNRSTSSRNYQDFKDNQSLPQSLTAESQLQKQQQKGGFNFENLLKQQQSPANRVEFSYSNFIKSVRDDQKTSSGNQGSSGNQAMNSSNMSPSKNNNILQQQYYSPQLQQRQQQLGYQYNNPGMYINSNQQVQDNLNNNGQPTQGYQNNMGYNSAGQLNQNQQQEDTTSPVSRLSRLQSLKKDKERIQGLQFEKEFELYQQRQLMLRQNMKDTVTKAKEKYRMMQQQLEQDMRQYYQQIDTIQKEIDQQEQLYSKQVTESQNIDNNGYKFKFLKTDTPQNSMLQQNDESQEPPQTSLKPNLDLQNNSKQNMIGNLPKLCTLSNSQIHETQDIHDTDKIKKQQQLDSQGVDNLTLQKMVIGSGDRSQSSENSYASANFENLRNSFSKSKNDLFFTIEKSRIRDEDLKKDFKNKQIQSQESDNSSIYKTIPNSHANNVQLARAPSPDLKQKEKSPKPKENNNNNNNNLLTYQSLRFNTQLQQTKQSIFTQESINYGPSNLFGKQRIENSQILGQPIKPSSKTSKQSVTTRTSRLQSKLMNSITLDKYLQDDQNNFEDKNIFSQPITKLSENLSEEEDFSRQEKSKNREFKIKLKDMDNKIDESIQTNTQDNRSTSQSREQYQKLFQEWEQNNQHFLKSQRKMSKAEIELRQRKLETPLQQRNSRNSSRRKTDLSLPKPSSSRIYETAQQIDVDDLKLRRTKRTDKRKEVSSWVDSVAHNSRNTTSPAQFSEERKQAFRQQKMRQGLQTGPAYRRSYDGASVNIGSDNLGSGLVLRGPVPGPRAGSVASGQGNAFWSPRENLSRPESQVTMDNFTQDSSIARFENDLSTIMKSELSNFT